jgi:PEP-CTERM putative exosortase interaction domain
MLRRCVVVSAAVVAAHTGLACATNYTIDWLDMSPTTAGQPVPNNSSFFLAGLGNVTVSYSIPGTFTHARTVDASLQNGSVTSGPDTYSWAGHELFGATLTGASTAQSWDITYTFSGPVSAGSLYLGIAGLGATTQSPSGAGATVATVLQNGTFIGDYAGNPANNWGPTLFTGGPGVFLMQNSLAAPGGQNPHWNSQLGIVRIDDVVSSLTVRFNQLPGDGCGVNLGYVVPAPGAMALLGLAGLGCGGRRRR